MFLDCNFYNFNEKTKQRLNYRNLNNKVIKISYMNYKFKYLNNNRIIKHKEIYIIGCYE